MMMEPNQAQNLSVFDLETDDPDRPQPLREMIGDPDSPSPLRSAFATELADLLEGDPSEIANIASARSSTAGEVEVPVRGTYVAIVKNGTGILFAGDIVMSGLNAHAELQPVAGARLSFVLIGRTVRPQLFNRVIVTAPPVFFEYLEGDRFVRVQDRDGVHKVVMRPLVFAQGGVQEG
jgi:hypothetical protein